MVSRVRRDVRSVLRSRVDAVGPLCFREWAAEDLRSVWAEADRDGPLEAIVIIGVQVSRNVVSAHCLLFVEVPVDV